MKNKDQDIEVLEYTVIDKQNEIYNLRGMIEDLVEEIQDLKSEIRDLENRWNDDSEDIANLREALDLALEVIGDMSSDLGLLDSYKYGARLDQLNKLLVDL